MGPSMIVGGVLVVVAIAVVIAVMARRKRGPVADADTFRRLMNGGQAAPANESKEEMDLRQNLRVKLLHQEDKVNAAIEFERQRDPAAPLPALMRAAIARWERDNR